MKFNLVHLIVCFIAFWCCNLLLYAQNDPEPPEPPEGEPAPLFDDFQQMTKKNEDKILKNIPPEIKEDLLKVKKIDEDEYYNILSESPHFYFALQSSLC